MRHDMGKTGENNVTLSHVKNCAVCDSPHLELALDLPDFPLTGIFVSPNKVSSHPRLDQAFMHCQSCGHAQLRSAVDPVYLYQDTYTHRTSQSPIATRGNDFFLAFLRKLVGNKRFESIVEIGCNDLYMLKELVAVGSTLTGIDPMWKGREAEDSRIRILPKYVEELGSSDFPSPDLVLSAHTFEHVISPFESLRILFELAGDECLFVIEVPGFDSLLNAYRFDQIFHQHFNYFSVASMRRLIQRLGGEYLCHEFNYGFWQGTMLMAFCKPKRKTVSESVLDARVVSLDVIRERYASFKRQIESIEQVLETAKKTMPIYGYGAAQMVPALAYHFAGHLEFLDCIFDDNSAKNGLRYPSLSVPICAPPDVDKIREGAVFVTAMDSRREILPALIKMKARQIFPVLGVI